MTIDHRDMIHRINSLMSDMDALYHQAALRLGVSDSVLYVLYELHLRGDGCPLSEIRQTGGISKQTLNSALRQLEAEGLIYLEKDRGRSKHVRLTPAGLSAAAATGGRLFECECRAFDQWDEDEVRTCLRLMEKYNQALAHQLQTL